MTRPAPPDSPAAGFTLIEVAAAATIGAASIAALLQVFGDGAIRSNRAGQERLALMIAQSALEGAEGEGPLVPGAVRGGSGHGMTWRLDVGEYATTAATNRATDPLPEARLLTVTVQGGNGTGPVLARLATLRLVPAPAGLAEPDPRLSPPGGRRGALR